jgi:hypothetical protein
LIHYAAPSFWRCYHALPPAARKLADEKFALLKSDPSHPSLHFKRIRQFYSVRVGRSYRSLGMEAPDGVLWFWIGTHDEYDRLVA